MRVALRIAYDGRVFSGHQRQPDVRTAEGECIAAAKLAKLFRDPGEAFFRSASRTDRGVSAVANVIAFNTGLRADAVLGAFNDRARDVWAWAFAPVPDDFHPRRAHERWYRYHLLDDLPLARLREAAALFEGVHDFRSFTSQRVGPAAVLRKVEISTERGMTFVDLYAPSFLRGMVRRVVSAIVARARGAASLDDIACALRGERGGFGTMPPEPLFLMDVRYDTPFQAVLKGKVRDEWRRLERGARLRLELLRSLQLAVSPSQDSTEQS